MDHGFHPCLATPRQDAVDRVVPSRFEPDVAVDHNLISFTGKVDPKVQYQLAPPGTCLSLTPAERIDTTPVPCAQTHALEVTGAVDLTNRLDHAPTDDELRQAVDGDCAQIATRYLGRPIDPGFASGLLELAPGSWDAGHRATECTLGRYAANGTLIATSGPLRR
jgi:Septum formation